MPMTIPRVSVGVPVYNGEKYLAATVESILNQTYSDLELIVSDNGSTDGTRAICEAFAARDPRFRYYREEINSGAPWNISTGGPEPPITALISAPEVLMRSLRNVEGKRRFQAGSLDPAEPWAADFLTMRAAAPAATAVCFKSFLRVEIVGTAISTPSFGIPALTDGACRKPTLNRQRFQFQRTRAVA